MKDAVEEWDSLPWDTKNVLKKPHPSFGLVSMTAFAKKKGIPHFTFHKYASNTERREIGGKVGRKSIVREENSKFIAQTIVRADRANKGKTPGEVQEDLMALEPDLTSKQVENFFNRTFKKNHAGLIKPRAVRAQKTTTKRSQCTVSQQYRWRKRYKNGLKFLREKNTGLCKMSGKTFGEIMEHFIVGGDETNLIADADGNMKIMAEFGRPKHEKLAGDFRGSITMYRTGSCGATNGPTGFLTAGKRRRAGYTDKFLRNNGCAEGSTIACNENAFMTKETWNEISKSIVPGIRAMPYIKANPDWWVLEIFDGFGAHLLDEESLRLRWINKILSLKEEGDSSSINQVGKVLIHLIIVLSF